MKIAVFHNLPSGGAKRALFNYCRYLAQSGHTVDLTVPESAGEEYLPLQQLVRQVRRFPNHRGMGNVIPFCVRYGVNPILLLSKTMRRLIPLEVAQRAIARFVNTGEYDFVLVEQSRLLYSPFLLRYLEKPSVYFCQQPLRLREGILQPDGSSGQRGGSMKSRRLVEIDSRNAACADLVLTNSCYSRESILREYGLESFVSYLGVDEAVFRPLPAERSDFVLSVGAIQPAKAFGFLVSALGQVPKRVRPRLILVGNTASPKEKAYLESLAGRVDVHLEIRVMVREEELVHLYGTAAAFVYAPRLEPFGLAVLEAMACGTPVVAVREGGVRESVVDQETGVLVDRDESMFAEVLAALLSDAPRRRTLGAHARDAVLRTWTTEKAGERLMTHVERLLHSAGRAGG